MAPINGQLRNLPFFFDRLPIETNMFMIDNIGTTNENCKLSYLFT
jgi:hypothetical protein